MRILHTGDWHLGKYLGNFSRLPEQAEFIDELVTITRDKAVDMVVVAGDVFDTHNPPADAERLFYQALRRLTSAREVVVPVVVIAGNHDNPLRLSAAEPIALSTGVLMIGTQDTVISPGTYEGFAITESGEGYFTIETKAGRATVAAVPSPGERRLNMLFDGAEGYADKVGQLMEQLAGHFKVDTVNLLAGHFYIAGGVCSENSERPLTVGGAYAVDSRKLPEAAQYVAMGHLHRPQTVPGHACAYYAGSPIQYALSETNYAKCVILADIEPGCPAVVEKVYLRNYKPIEQWKAGSIAEAIDIAESRGNEHSWAYLTIKTDKPLMQSELKRIRAAKRDIIEIQPELTTVDTPAQKPELERSPGEMFAAYYQEKKNAPPSDALLALFAKLSQEYVASN